MILGPTLVTLGVFLGNFRPKIALVRIHKPLESILDNFHEYRFLFIEALYVVNLPSVQGVGVRLELVTKK